MIKNDYLLQEEELQEKRADYERKKIEVDKSMKNIETQERKLEERRKRFKEDREKFEDEQDVCNICIHCSHNFQILTDLVIVSCDGFKFPNKMYLKTKLQVIIGSASVRLFLIVHILT